MAGNEGASDAFSLRNELVSLDQGEVFRERFLRTAPPSEGNGSSSSTDLDPAAINRLLQQHLPTAQDVSTTLQSLHLLNEATAPDTARTPTLRVSTGTRTLKFWHDQSQVPKTPVPPNPAAIEALGLRPFLNQGAAQQRSSGMSTYEKSVKLPPHVGRVPSSGKELRIWDLRQVDGTWGRPVIPKPLNPGPRDEEGWREFAACKGHPDVFFPPLGSTAGENNEAKERAKQICEQECPVQIPCDDYARRHGMKSGTWGGQTLRYPEFSKDDLTQLDKGLRVIKVRRVQAERLGLERVDLLRPIPHTPTAPYKLLDFEELGGLPPQVLQETLTGIEPGFSPDFFELLGAVGNHQVKALTFLEIAKNGGRIPAHKISGIPHRMAKRVGARWIPSRGSGKQFAMYSFVPAKLMQPVQEADGTEAYDQTPEKLPQAIALAGLTLACNLVHPDFSIQDAPGPSNAPGGISSPQIRTEHIYDLVTHPQQESGVGGDRLRGFTPTMTSRGSRAQAETSADVTDALAHAGLRS
jgi:hypothetical protein